MFAGGPVVWLGERNTSRLVTRPTFRSTTETRGEDQAKAKTGGRTATTTAAQRAKTGR